ncbi:InlB B-repeat-containing protein [Shewanella abyssi]|uniref:InlB B-repeat-containing protein n=1 Tax=Shewanella abyssi TaxID=311789 RepID=UPI00200F836B|nr:InlB B-repeat-containing protein [Shewanella abyssi]MCL1048538.1 InlB B-repeat-containing protein [Shewanella abyssi]
MVLLSFFASLFVNSAYAGADSLVYIEELKEGVDDIQGLNGISDVTVSPDGKFVYTASHSSAAVSVFARNANTGELTYSSTTNDIEFAFSVDVSPDNNSVYVASPGGEVHAFSRDQVDGSLTFVNSLAGTTTAGFVSVSVSPNGKYVYGVGGAPSGLVVFSRDPETSALTLIEDYIDNVDADHLGQFFNPTQSPIKNIATSADGQYLYVTSTKDHAVSLFKQDELTGELSMQAGYVDGVDGFEGLTNASSVKITPDGKHLYVSGQGASSIVILDIDSVTGELTYIGKVTNGLDGVDSISGARSLAISPDGRYVIASAISSDSITSFSRDAITGLLTVDTVITNSDEIPLVAPSGMATDPLNRHLYVTSQNSHSLFVFSLPTPAVKLVTSSAIAQVSGPAILLDSQLEVVDSDSLELAYGTVSISEGFIDTDVLAVQGLPSIATNYDAATGVLSLTGSAPLADYQTVLRSLTYQAGADSSLAPGNSSTRLVGIEVSDGENISASVIIDITVQKPNGFNVTFVDWDSAVLSSQLIALNGAAIAPNAPVRLGYGFIGWDVEFDDVTANKTVTAQYSINSYVLSFYSAGGSLIADISYSFAAVVSAPASPTRSGYAFTGWSPVIPGTMPASDSTLTAQWSVNSYTLSFDSGEGSPVTAITAEFGTAINAPVAPTWEGYSFAGWSPVIPDSMPASDSTLTAQWSVNSYTLSFDSGEGSPVTAITTVFGEDINAPADPTRTGYSFGGWSPVIPGTMPAANSTLTAQWSVNSYTLSFDSGEGSPVTAITTVFGEDINAPADPTRTGYSFAGWSPVIPDSMPASDSTLTAQWSVNSYTLSFDSGEGSPVTAISAEFGEVINAPADPTWEGYSFGGWSPVIPGSMPASDSTLTAQWSVNSYTLSFDSGEGSPVTAITAEFGAAIDAPAAPTWEGYSFAGWSPVIPGTMPASDSTLTAQWSVNSYTLSFDSGEGSPVTAITAEFGTAINAPAAPTWEGYSFSDWSPEIPATMPAQNLLVKAVYEQVMLAVTATVEGEATISPSTQQVSYGSAAIFELSLVNVDDIVLFSGSCGAARSGSQVVTAVVKENCVVAVNVYPTTDVDKESDAALASNDVSRFSFINGAGDKSLVSGSILRSGIMSELTMSDIDELLTEQGDASYLFSARRTGRYTFEFVDSVSGELVSVTFDVLPYLAFTSSQQPTQQDTETSIRVWLSDEPIEYPVTSTVIKEGVSSTLQKVELTADDQLLRRYTVTTLASEAQISLQQSDISNALLGSPAVHKLIVQQQAPALSLTVKATQNSTETKVVSQTGGSVVLSVMELNGTEASYSWSSSNIILQAMGETASFDPSLLALGRYIITIDAETSTGQVGQYELALHVIEDCPVESCEGAGLSGIPDSENSFSATPNRLPLCPDVDIDNRVGQCQVSGSQMIYAEVPNLYQLSLGVLSEEQSWRTGQFGLALTEQTLADTGFSQQGLVVNFDVLGLERPGESVPIAIPLLDGVTIPADAVWRKYIQQQWQDFVVDNKNSISSAPRDALGQCPGVSSDDWTTGLTEGHGCVRLTIEDGGPNDDDGLANSAIRDPGVLAIMVNQAPIANADIAETDDRTSLVIDVLLNDTDIDGDPLSVIAASADQGQVVVNDDNTITYLPKSGFDGVDVISYTISDGEGFTANGVVNVTVKAYQKVEVINKSSGGSLGIYTLLLLALLLCKKVAAFPSDAGRYGRKKIKQTTMSLKLVILTLLGVSCTFTTQAEDFQVSLLVGHSKVDVSTNDLQKDVSNGEVSYIDKSSTSWSAEMAYLLSADWQLTLGYVDFGEGGAHITGDTLDTEAYHEEVANVTPLFPEGAMAGARYRLLSKADWDIQAEAGVLYWRSDISSRSGDEVLRSRNDGTDWYASLQTSYQFSPQWAATARVRYYNLPYEIAEFSIGATFRF